MLVVFSVGRFSLEVVSVPDVVKAGTEAVSLVAWPPVGVMTVVPLLVVAGVLEAGAAEVESLAVSFAVDLAGVEAAGVDESAAGVDVSAADVAALGLVVAVVWVAGVVVLAEVVVSAAMAATEKRDTATTAERRSVRFSETRDRPILIVGFCE